MKASKNAPPAFLWDDWYAGLGGRISHSPETDEYLRKIFEEQCPQLQGEVATKRVHFESPEAASQHLKEKAQEYGADLVGICEIEASDIIKGQEINEKYALVTGARMRYRAFQEVPSLESALECTRIYHVLGDIAIKLARHIRSLGYQCQLAHPIEGHLLLHIPLALKAGFGELGRHGSIINPKLGPLFRIGSLATSIPLAVDHPIDAGIAAFCDKCKACRIYCPAKAIPDERQPEAGKDHLGNDRYMVDTAKCFPYFRQHHYCSICLPVCVYNHKEWAKDFEGFPTKKFPDVDMQVPPPPYDGIPDEHKHNYPRLNRNDT